MDKNISKLFDILHINTEDLKTIFDSLPLGVIITDITGKIVYYNETHSKMNGKNHSSLEQEKMEESSDTTNVLNLVDIFQNRTLPILGDIFPYKTVSGKILNIAYWAYPLLKEKQKVGSLFFTQPLSPFYNEAIASQNSKLKPYLTPIHQKDNFEIIGKNESFLNALNLAKDNIETSCPILISGESGSGKEILAKFIHNSSTRADKPFFSLNCSAIPESLLSTLLFGPEEDNKSSANQPRGVLLDAKGGTLYLDDLDSMSLELQEKLFRSFQKMGSLENDKIETLTLNFKFVVSIKPTPLEALRSKRIFPDLFTFLTSIVVELPPLRNRLDDFEGLTNYFIKKYNYILNKQILTIEPLLWVVMKKYNWPGNIRELEHMLKEAISQAAKDEFILTYSHINSHYQQNFLLSNVKRSEFSDSEIPNIVLSEKSSVRPNHLSLTDSILIVKLLKEEEELRLLMRRNRGNISRAAKEINISRQLLTYRLKKFGIKPRDFSKDN
ncbi:MAG: sigma 54-interacting transcriptional regulator [Deltaproteobacteria bacterium]|nr:sigma 54-interacting transcriptional regulator [Deltaproteobacteria bacterium]